MDFQLKTLLKDTILIARLSTAGSTAGDGERIYLASSSAAARVDGYRELHVKGDGQQVETKNKITLSSSVGELDLVYLPGESTSDPAAGWMVHRVRRYLDEYGNVDYYEVLA